jgi:serine/threonine protein kinase
MKVINFKNEEDYTYKSGIVEKTILFLLNHPNIIKIIEGWTDIDSKNIYLILEFNNISLKSYLFDHRIYVTQTKSMMKQILQAVEFLHKNELVHRDIRPDNITYDGDTIKLIDFGECTNIENVHKDLNVVALPYRSIELLLEDKDNCGYGIDMWSVGCTFYDILNDGCRLFTIADSADLILKIIQNLGPLNNKTYPNVENIARLNGHCIESKSHKEYKNWIDICKDYKSLILEMLTLYPPKRITATKALTYFN